VSSFVLGLVLVLVGLAALMAIALAVGWQFVAGATVLALALFAIVAGETHR
jgi:hypothetical protein